MADSKLFKIKVEVSDGMVGAWCEVPYRPVEDLGEYEDTRLAERLLVRKLACKMFRQILGNPDGYIKWIYKSYSLPLVSTVAGKINLEFPRNDEYEQL